MSIFLVSEIALILIDLSNNIFRNNNNYRRHHAERFIMRKKDPKHYGSNNIMYRDELAF